MAASAEVLPAGNEWQFSELNYYPELIPRPGSRVVYQPAGLLQEVTQNVQDRFIEGGWQFAALVQSLPAQGEISHHLSLIFTHPSRTELFKS